MPIAEYILKNPFKRCYDIYLVFYDKFTIPAATALRTSNN